MSQICSYAQATTISRGFKKYSELISCRLVGEQNNELLMKNHKSRPTGATLFPETNVVFSNNYGRGRDHGGGRGCNHGSGRSNYAFDSNNHSDFKKITNDDHRVKTPQKW